MSPEEYKNTEPKIKIEEYFLGNVKAGGIFKVDQVKSKGNLQQK